LVAIDRGRAVGNTGNCHATRGHSLAGAGVLVVESP
jgi:hypothetical protein